MYRSLSKKFLNISSVRRLTPALEKYERDTIELMDRVFLAAGEIFSEQLTILVRSRLLCFVQNYRKMSTSIIRLDRAKSRARSER